MRHEFHPEERFEVTEGRWPTWRAPQIGTAPVRPVGEEDRFVSFREAEAGKDPEAKVTAMSLFRRRERPDPGPSYAEEESNPELLAAEKAVNQMPSVPMVGGVPGVILGQRPQIVGLPDDDADPSEDDADPSEDDADPEQS